MLNKAPNKVKFDPKSKAGIFLGYSTESKAYRFWDPEKRKIVGSQDVTFLDHFETFEVLNEHKESSNFEPAYFYVNKSAKHTISEEVDEYLDTVQESDPINPVPEVNESSLQ